MRPKALLTPLLLLAATAGAAQAQFSHKPALTLDGAKRIMAAAGAEARRQSFPASIAIVDDGGHLLLLERLEGWTGASANVAIGKARTAALFRRSTGDFEEIIRNGRTAMVALDDFTPLQGGVPLMVDGQLVGAIGISGSSPAKDEEIARMAAAALNGASTPSGTPEVIYFDREQVAAAFAKGEVLLDGENGREYMVHASRREGPGMAEVHTRDTDVIYVLGGTAELITGGEVVDGRATAPDEIRGSSIRGGQARRLAPGDVLVVPPGTPHWFRRVQSPLTYYVVKVR